MWTAKLWPWTKTGISLSISFSTTSKAQALLLYIFDVLVYRGRSLLDVPLSARRETLSEIFKGAKAAPLALPTSYS